MKILIPTETIRDFLRWSRRGLFAVAAIALGYCLFVLADGWIFQRNANHQLEALAIRPAAPLGPAATEMPGLIGRLQIPRLGLSVIIAEGTNESTLRRAVGHIAGTALPGRSGNIGIAGHRDTLFRPLRNIQLNDLITLTTLHGNFQYRVLSTQIVNPADVSVLNSDGRDVLTLVTCHPFYFVGPAPDRFIVRAGRVGGTT